MKDMEGQGMDGRVGNHVQELVQVPDTNHALSVFNAKPVHTLTRYKLERALGMQMGAKLKYASSRRMLWIGVVRIRVLRMNRVMDRTHVA